MPELLRIVCSIFLRYLNPQYLDLKSIDVLVIVVLGGMGSLSGSVLAILAIISTILQDFSDLRMIIYALLLVIIMIFRPQGLMGSKEISMKVFRNLAVCGLPGREK